MNKFTKVTEWLSAGNMASGFYLVEAPITKTTDKAVGFAAKKMNEFGNLKDSIMWVPKAKACEIHNDFYVNGPLKMFLIPEWIFSAKMREGFEF
jgi:hypothetical protein